MWKKVLKMAQMCLVILCILTHLTAATQKLTPREQEIKDRQDAHQLSLLEAGKQNLKNRNKSDGSSGILRQGHQALIKNDVIVNSTGLIFKKEDIVTICTLRKNKAKVRKNKGKKVWVLRKFLIPVSNDFNSKLHAKVAPKLAARSYKTKFLNQRKDRHKTRKDKRLATFFASGKFKNELKKAVKSPKQFRKNQKAKRAAMQGCPLCMRSNGFSWVVVCSNCKVPYHKNCIRNMVKSGGRNNHLCPTCRKPIEIMRTRRHKDVFKTRAQAYSCKKSLTRKISFDAWRKKHNIDGNVGRNFNTEQSDREMAQGLQQNGVNMGPIPRNTAARRMRQELLARTNRIPSNRSNPGQAPVQNRPSDVSRRVIGRPWTVTRADSRGRGPMDGTVKKPYDRIVVTYRDGDTFECYILKYEESLVADQKFVSKPLQNGTYLVIQRRFRGSNWVARKCSNNGYHAEIVDRAPPANVKQAQFGGTKKGSRKGIQVVMCLKPSLDSLNLQGLNVVQQQINGMFVDLQKDLEENYQSRQSRAGRSQSRFGRRW